LTNDIGKGDGTCFTGIVGISQFEHKFEKTNLRHYLVELGSQT